MNLHNIERRLAKAGTGTTADPEARQAIEAAVTDETYVSACRGNKAILDEIQSLLQGTQGPIPLTREQEEVWVMCWAARQGAAIRIGAERGIDQKRIRDELMRGGR